MKPFNIQEVIKTRVNREAEFDHAKDTPVAIPKYQKPKIKVGQAGWYVFFRQILP